MKKIWLAGGCFWGVEAYFRQIRGVEKTVVGYGQGSSDSPDYRQVCSGMTGHAEICEVTYNETVLSLRDILEHLFRIIDPTAKDRQGPDVGTQYRSGVYYTDEADETVIAGFLQEKAPAYQAAVVVEGERLTSFWAAEEYHQNYLGKNPGGYCHVDLQKVHPNERQ